MPTIAKQVSNKKQFEIVISNTKYNSKIRKLISYDKAINNPIYE